MWFKNVYEISEEKERRRKKERKKKEGGRERRVTKIERGKVERRGDTKRRGMLVV